MGFLGDDWMLVEPCEMAFFPVKFHVTFGARGVSPWWQQQRLLFLSLDLAAFLSSIKFWHFGRKQARDQGLVTRLLHHFNNVFIWCCWPFLGSYHFPTSRFHSSHKYTLIDDFFFQRNNAVEKTRHFFAQQTLESRLLLEIWGQDKWWCGKKVF